MATYAFATQAALVAVDVESGEVEVLSIVACHDVGKAVNPDSVTGQIEGGVSMGLGFSLMEEIVLQEGASVTVDDVMLHCRRHLEDFKVPQQVVFVAQLPRTQAGKIRRSSGGD